MFIVCKNKFKHQTEKETFFFIMMMSSSKCVSISTTSVYAKVISKRFHKYSVLKN